MNNRVDDNLIHFGANEELVRTLFDTQVKFVVVGGLAVSWHCSARQADDMDLLVEPTHENSSRIARALSQLNISGFRDDSFVHPGLQVPLKQHYYAEFLTPEVDGLSYAAIEAKAVQAKLFGLPVRLASVESLVHMKRRAAASLAAQSLKHQSDIALLERCNVA